MSKQKLKCLLSVCQHHLNWSEMYLSQCSGQAVLCASLRRYLCVCRPKAETQIWKTESSDMKSLMIFLRYWMEVTNMTKAGGWEGRPDPRCPPRIRSMAESLLQLTGKAAEPRGGNSKDRMDCILLSHQRTTDLFKVSWAVFPTWNCTDFHEKFSCWPSAHQRNT